MNVWAYRKGLHDLGNTVYAYLQPSGSWGWSNAGIVTDGEASLLIDTLFDLRLTQEMLDTMRRSIPAARHIDMLVNTHAHGDHIYGNQLVADAHIIASARTAEEMGKDIPPEVMAALVKQAPALGALGEYFGRIYGPFQFEGITITPPKQTFSGSFTLKVGNKEVQLLEVGPAHTQGDTLVYIPGDKTIFTGDILFVGTHPIIWSGPIGNWLRACDLLLSLDVETIVPGHGPITDKHGVAVLKEYFEYIYSEARQRYESGMSSLEAAQDISLDRYATWTDSERMAVNIETIYRELSGDQEPANVVSQFGQMAWLATAKSPTMEGTTF